MAALAAITGADINDSVTEFQVDTPLTRTLPFIMLVEDELMKVTDYDGSTYPVVLRGFGPSIPAAHVSGTNCYLVVGVVGSGSGYVVNYIGDSGSVETREVATGAGGGSLTLDVKRTKITLSTADLVNMHDTPIIILGGPGVGKMFVPISAMLMITTPAHGLSLSLNPHLSLKAGVNELAFTGSGFYGKGPNAQGFLPGIRTLISGLYEFGQSPGSDGDSAYNQPLVLTTGFGEPSIAYAGTIASTSLDSGGSGYAPGDTITLNAEDGVPATVVVDTVDGGGAVLTYHVSVAGDNYTTGLIYTQSASSGAGVDAGFLITDIIGTSDTVAELTVVYYIAESIA